jgi:HEAT repeat protein
MNGGKWAAALRNPDARLRQKAAFTLGNIGSSDGEVLPALIEALQDTDAAVRCEAILALLKVGADAADAVPTLIEIRQQDDDPKVREYAARALERLGDDPTKGN